MSQLPSVATAAPAQKPATVNGPRPSPLAIMGQKFNIEPARLLDTLRGTVIKPDKEGRHASNEEVAAFVIVANQYDLNPFTREIHAFVGRGGGIVPIVGIDGWVSLVNRHPNYDGCEFREENQDGKPVFTTCIMYAKNRHHPVKVTEWFSECCRNTDPWKQMPRRMLRHKAYIQAARICFGLNGIYDDEEGQDVVHQYAAQVVDQPALPVGRVHVGNARQQETAPDEKGAEAAGDGSAGAAQSGGQPPTQTSPTESSVREATADAGQNSTGQGESLFTPEAGARQDLINDLDQKISEAKDARDLPADADIVRNRDLLGEQEYDRLVKALADARAKLTPVETKSARKR